MPNFSIDYHASQSEILLQKEIASLQQDIQDNKDLAIEVATQLNYLVIQAYKIVNQQPHSNSDLKIILGILLHLSNKSIDAFECM